MKVVSVQRDGKLVTITYDTGQVDEQGKPRLVTQSGDYPALQAKADTLKADDVLSSWSG